jgi:hypothetical protein
VARGSVQRRFPQRLRGSALPLDYNHGVAETSPFGELYLIWKFTETSIAKRKAIRTTSSRIESSMPGRRHISGEMAYDCQQAIKRFIKYDIRAPGLMWGHNSGSDAMFLLRMSRWSQKVAADNTITIAGDEGEAQNGMGNWVRINYTCTVNLNNKTVKRAAFNQGRLQ